MSVVAASAEGSPAGATLARPCLTLRLSADYDVRWPPGVAAADFLAAHEAAINEVVFDAVVRHGGSIAAEHGIGQLRRAELARRKPAVALEMMRAIKRALDPQGVFNPGRVV